MGPIHGLPVYDSQTNYYYTQRNRFFERRETRSHNEGNQYPLTLRDRCICITNSNHDQYYYYYSNYLDYHTCIALAGSRI